MEPDALSPRLGREARTVAAMIRLYCAGRHGVKRGLCAECTELAAYARRRLEYCPFGHGKPTCAKCPVHCYRPDMRAKIRAVMRYAGPRMLFRHPMLALLHLFDGRRSTPDLAFLRGRNSEGAGRYFRPQPPWP